MSNAVTKSPQTSICDYAMLVMEVFVKTCTEFELDHGEPLQTDKTNIKSRQE